MRLLPKVQLAFSPTPVELLPRLSDYLNGPRIMVKRDDLTGLAFGGNKTRKLELLVADAQSRQARTLITAGAVQSNHCRQTAAAAARYGLDCILVLTGDPPDQFSGNLLLDRLLGAEIVWSTKAEREHTLQDVFEEAKSAGRNPYLIPYGGSNAIGATAYAYAIKELIEQQAQPDWVVVASSSGGTQAGMVVGAKLFNFQGKILGISIDEDALVLSRRISGLANEISALLEESLTFSVDEIIVNDRYLGEGYGVMGDAEREAIELFARHEGLLLDPVYTGRAAAGMIDLIRNGYFPRDSSVLFWHTGGTPALFASQYQSKFK